MQVAQGKCLVSFKLKERKMGKTVPYKTGRYTLKISATSKTDKSNTWTDDFEVV